MVDLKTKNEIIDYLLKNDLKEIQENFYSFVDDNKYNMILFIFETIFVDNKSNLSKDVNYMGNTKFENFNVKHFLIKQ